MKLPFGLSKERETSPDVESLPTSEESEGKGVGDYPDTTSEVHPGFKIAGSVAQFNGGSVGVRYAVPVSWHHLTYAANGRKILRGLTGTALPSRCLAVMGSSGAGKTTFLNAICDRLASSNSLKISGTRQLGDVEYKRHYRKLMGFVAQDDILSALATPEDSLRFSLRVRRGTSKKETQERVEETLQELRLTHCRDTVVGIPGLVAGLSGGERKRCSIGVELICDPKILLLDEPTSGLDSVTSVKIVNLLNTLSRTGRTVIYTIHQPTAEALDYFDDIMLLTEGVCVYHGPMSKSVEYFESIGYPCPITFTPTDFFMTLLQDPPTSKILIKKWKKFLKYAKRSPHTTAIELNPNPEDSETARFLNGYIAHFKSTFWIQFSELVRRYAIVLSRNRMFLVSNLTQALFFALFVGLIFINIKHDVTSVQDRQGLLFMTTMNRAMGQCFIMINSFMHDKPLYVREQQVGSYSPIQYFLARTVVEFPMRVFFALLESIVLYFMTRLYRDPGAFFYYFGVLTLLTEVTSGLGFAIGAIFESLVVASAIAPMILLPLALAGGLFASTTRLRPYWYWLEKPSFLRHTFILLMRNEMKHLTHIDCTNPPENPQYCANQAQNGEQVLQQLGFEDAQSVDWIMWVSMAILYFVFRIIAVIALSVAARTKF